MPAKATAKRTLRRVVVSPLSFPGYVDDEGRAVPYPALEEGEKLRLAAALSLFKAEVARIADLRIAALAPNFLCAIRATVKE